MSSYYLTAAGVKPARPPLDSAWGLLQGYGLFETLRVSGRRILQLPEHLERLTESAARLRLPLPDTPALEQAVSAVLQREALAGGGRFRIVLARSGVDNSQVIFTLESLAGYPVELYKRGMRAKLLDSPRNEKSPLARLKTISFLENLLGRAEAQSAGVDEGIFLNTGAQLAEGTFSNLFWFAGAGLHTPSRACGCLPGVTRAWTLAAARKMGIEVDEGAYPVTALDRADEAFLTSSLMGIMPLTELDGLPIGGGRPGPGTARLREAYEELLREQLY